MTDDKNFPAAQAAHTYSRRTFLRGSLGVGALALGGGLLAACSSSGDGGGSGKTTAAAASSSSGSSAAGSVAPGAYGDVSLQLSWIKNIEFAGEYFATENGYYTAAGFSKVDLVAGPVDSGVEALLSAGSIDIGLSSPDATATAINSGATLKIIASTYQKNPFCLLSLKEKTPIATVADLKGKKIGVQAGTNQTIVEGFLKANGLTDKDVTIVPTQYDIKPLEEGKYDAHMSYLTNEPILAKADGFTPVTLGFADNGLPLVAETYTVTQDTLDNKRDMLKALLIAEIKGWKDAIAAPSKSAELAVTKYGKDQKLGLGEQTSEATAQNDLIVSADTKANGLFTLTDEKVAGIIKALSDISITISADDLFDLSIIKEIYSENPDLI